MAEVYRTSNTPGVPPSLSVSRLRRLWSRPTLWVGLTILIFLILFCFLGPVAFPQNPLAVHLTHLNQPPSARFPLGTDSLGRSELSRMMYGGRGLILVGLASSAVAAVLGTLVGLIGAVFGGWVDRMTTWATDVVLSIPQLLPLMLIMVLLRPSPLTMVFVVGATTWPLIARLVRAEALSIRERDYIEAARSLGASQWRILLQHLLPNLWGTILTASSNQVAAAMLVVATVSFLGFGLPPPSPNWAGMVSSGTNDLMLGSWWLMLFPGLAFILLQFSVNFIAEAIRSALTIQGGIQ